MELNAQIKKEYPFESHYLKLNGHKLHYIDEGQGPEVFVLVHGNPTWSFYYRNIIKELRSDYRVVAIDHMGCGLSDKPEDYNYSLEQRIHDLGSLLNSLGINEYHLMVHDWGGAIGLGNAVKNPSKVKSVTILNTAAFKSQEIPFSISLCKLPVLGPFIVKYFNAFCYPATFMTTEQPLSKHVKEAYLLPYDTVKNRRAISDFVQDIPLSKNHRSYKTLDEIEGKLKDLTCAKYIFWGGKDFCFNDHFFNRWKEIYPEAKINYYEDAGHYVLEDKGDKIVHELKSYLGGTHVH